MNQHEVLINEQQEAKEKLESEETAYEQAAADYCKKKESCDKLRSELSSSLTETGEALERNQGKLIS